MATPHFPPPCLPLLGQVPMPFISGAFSRWVLVRAGLMFETRHGGDKCRDIFTPSSRGEAYFRQGHPRGEVPLGDSLLV